jgi:hypothetical protein
MIKKILLLFLFVFTATSFLAIDTYADYEYGPIFWPGLPANYADPEAYELLSYSLEVESGATELFVHLPLLSDFFQATVESSGTQYSKVTFYDGDVYDGGTYVGDYRFGTDEALSGFDLNSDYIYISDYTSSAPTHMQFSLWFSFPYYLDLSDDSNFMQWFNDEFEYVFDDDLTQLEGASIVKFYNGLELWYQSYYSGIPDEPYQPTRSIYEFEHWYSVTNDTPYLFDESLAMPDYEPNYAYTYHLHAIYQDPVSPPEEIVDLDETNDTRLTTFLTSFGLYNDPGFMVIFVIISLLLTGSLLYLQMPSFIIIAINILLAALWIFLGWFPMYVTILLLISLVTGLVVSYKKSGGGVST